MATLNRNSAEWSFLMGLMDDRIAKHRTALESDSTPVDELALERAKLRSIITLKKMAEEALTDE